MIISYIVFLQYLKSKRKNNGDEDEYEGFQGDEDEGCQMNE